MSGRLGPRSASRVMSRDGARLRDWVRPRVGPPVDVVVAVLLLGGGLVEAGLGLTSDAAPWYVLVTVPFGTLPVAFRRRRPAGVLAVLVATFLVQVLLGSDLPGGLCEAVALVLVVFAGSAHTGFPRDVALLAASLAGMSLVVALGEDPHPANFVYLTAVVGAAWTAGYAVRSAEERSVRRAEERSREERARIAGELHDVVSHHVSAMVVQAAAERLDQPEGSPAARTLRDIETQGRETLTELRRMLGVLRIENQPALAPLAPPPGVDDVPALVHTTSRAGVHVTLRTEGDPVPLPETLSLAVYRIAQEALTNVRKHSASGTATLTLRWTPEHLEVEVLDGGRARRHPLLTGSGTGLRAMAERVRLHGGTVTAGAAGDHFRVHATLPLPGRP